MSILNFLANITSYASSGPSAGCGAINNPNQALFKWNLSVQNIPSDNVLSQALVIPANSSVTLFTGAAVRKFLYLQTDLQLSLLINGTITQVIKPFVIGAIVSPAPFVLTSDITSVVVTNPSTDTSANVFFAAAE
jgi:hypothetical protein